ncbi:hypothetical protein [Streptomyces sp. WAC 06783]|uniref:hypothetical protein n=1 Tax=Streptomyces sp. WAC 06783 TaxID=2203211 RepID=UPI000F738F71|nr:hypothetical protein [Streptomyces sp. WAC 06783]
MPARPPEAGRAGIRRVVAREANGREARITVDPGEFACARLVAELADEWVELAGSAGFSASSNRHHYRQAIRDFGTHVDARCPVPGAGAASLACRKPDVHHAVTEWVRLLPSRFAAGSRVPGWLADRVRILVGRRIAHPGRAVDTRLAGWVDGALGLRCGQTQELDEFTRADKKRLIHAALTDALAIRARLTAGRGLAATGIDPATGGWAEVKNLLWVANDAYAFGEISARLPPLSRWPAGLRQQVEAAGFGTQAGALPQLRRFAMSGADLLHWRRNREQGCRSPNGHRTTPPRATCTRSSRLLPHVVHHLPQLPPSPTSARASTRDSAACPVDGRASTFGYCGPRPERPRPATSAASSVAARPHQFAWPGVKVPITTAKLRPLR